MLKLPWDRGLRWALAGSILLVIFLVMQAPDEPGTVRHSGERENASSAVNRNARPDKPVGEGLDVHPPTARIDHDRVPATRQITPDLQRSPDSSGETAHRPAEDPYLSADTTGSDAIADTAGAETVNVGDYIDPEDSVTDRDNVVVEVGEYLDPDADIPGG